MTGQLDRLQHQQLQELLDREAIRRTLARYARGIDRVAPELISDAYHEVSWDHHGAFSGSGHDFAHDSEPAQLRSTDVNVVTHHLLGQCDIDLDGDVARCETYFWVTGIRNPEGRRRMYFLAGRYLDRLEKVDGRWRVRARNTVVDASTESAEGEAWPPAAGYTPGARWPHDAVFRFDEAVTIPGSESA
jgi:hypothetical protein